MRETKQGKNDVVVIDVKRVFGAVWHRIWMILLVAVLCALVVFLGSFYLIAPKYESAAMFYVNNSNFSLGDASLSISTGDITAAKSLVESYIVILDTRTTLNEVIDYAGVDRTHVQVRDMISAEAVNATEVFEVVVTSEDPYEAEKIASAIAYILPKRISNIIEGTSAKVVDTAVVAARPSSPNYTANTVLGFVLGVLGCVMVVALREMADITIRTEEDITRTVSHPVLTAIPNMAQSSKSAYYYSYSQKREQKKAASAANAKVQPLIGAGISFAASEAYKLLRTKLQFSFADDNKCRVIGVSSALAGEGKSLTSVNLAYSLSQLGKSVLLVDCDMRRPTLCEKLKIHKMPGMSNYLSGQCRWDDLMQPCGIEGEEDAFCVISSGRNPPNPIELLSSARMADLLNKLRQVCDYVILDLPPVREVSDALAVAKELDGILMVVRQNRCSTVDLATTMQEFEFIGAKILGVIYNCTQSEGGGYGKYYKRYYHRYYRRHYGKYEARKEETKSRES